MDYFLLNECIFIELINNKKEFIIKFLNSLNIHIEDYHLFEIGITNQNTKMDILLFAKDLVVNIELNKKQNSLKRNKIYYETLRTLLPSYNIVQVNINLFEYQNEVDGIFNYFNQNEYIRFLISKNYNNFESKNPYILDVIIYLNKLDKSKYINKIKKEDKIKEKLDNLFDY